MHGLSAQHCPDSTATGVVIDVSMELIDKISGSRLFIYTRHNKRERSAVLHSVKKKFVSSSSTNFSGIG